MINKHRDTQLGTEPLLKLILKLATPAMLAQIINMTYTLIDRIYIGHIPGVGSIALTALGICFPIITIISAFANMVGMGGAPLASIELGKQNRRKSEQILGNSSTMLVIFSIIITIFFSIYNKPILFKLGASELTIDYALDYISIYISGTIFVLIALGLNQFISAQGFASTAMISVIIGAILNTILDPIFIFVLNMGIKGAALATIISQAVSAIWVLRFLLSKKTGLRIKVENLKLNKSLVYSILALGVSPFIMQITSSLVTIVLNTGLQRMGSDIYISALTISQSALLMIITPFMGFRSGAMPIISYNYGAGNIKRVKQTFKIILIISLFASTLTSLLAFLIPETIASIFTSDTSLIYLVGKVMPIYLAGIAIFGIQIACQAAFLGTGNAKTSIFLAVFRKIILLIPLAIILPKITNNVISIFYAEAIADSVSGIVSGILLYFDFKKKFKNI